MRSSIEDTAIPQTQQPRDCVIRLKSPLPPIEATVTIDGGTQPYLLPNSSNSSNSSSDSWHNTVILDGKDLSGTDNAHGFSITASASDVVIKGFTVQFFAKRGATSKGLRTRIVGSHFHGNRGGGIVVESSAESAKIGDPTAGPRGRVVVTDSALYVRQYR